ncbi:MAG: SLC13 family permease, partial [Chloroflexi bacterium]|nr:SLC13 family permease [Chloroflexota bacterium]
SPDQTLIAISGFGQPVVVTLIGLFILSQALTDNGVMLWLGQRLAKAGADSEKRLIFLFVVTSVLLSQFMNNVTVGALLLPSAMTVVRRSKIRASKLLIPIAFGSALGGMSTYFTTANIVVSNLLTAAQPPQRALGILSFLPVGGLIAISGIAFIVFFGRRLLPARDPVLEQEMVRRASSELENLYAVGDRLWEARVHESSPLIGVTIQKCGVGEKFGIVVAAMRRGSRAFFVPLLSEVIQPADLLLIVGREDRVSKLADLGLELRPERHTLTTFGITLLESSLPPHSTYIGKTLREINFRNRYGFAAIALLRRERSQRTDVANVPLELGDSLLMVGPQNRVRDLRLNPNLIIFETDPATRPIPRRRALASILTFVSVIALSLLGIPVYLSVLTAALLAILFGLIPIQEAYRSIEWQVVFFIAGLYVASLGMVHTGLAALIGRSTIDLIGNAGPLGLAATAFLLSAALTQVMGSQASAFVIGPIAISAAIHLNTNPQAIAVATAIGCSASFLTPISHPVNLIMMSPGNYRFGDFFRVGAGLMLVVFVALLVGMVLFWRL